MFLWLRRPCRSQKCHFVSSKKPLTDGLVMHDFRHKKSTYNNDDSPATHWWCTGGVRMVDWRVVSVERQRRLTMWPPWQKKMLFFLWLKDRTVRWPSGGFFARSVWPYLSQGARTHTPGHSLTERCTYCSTVANQSSRYKTNSVDNLLNEDNKSGPDCLQAGPAFSTWWRCCTTPYNVLVVYSFLLYFPCLLLLSSICATALVVDYMMHLWINIEYIYMRKHVEPWPKYNLSVTWEGGKMMCASSHIIMQWENERCRHHRVEWCYLGYTWYSMFLPAGWGGPATARTLVLNPST